MYPNMKRMSTVCSMRVIVLISFRLCLFFFFFNDTATTEIYTLSLHDALPIWREPTLQITRADLAASNPAAGTGSQDQNGRRSEEHTSELQSQSNLVCRLLLEKKKTTHKTHQVNS